MKVATGTVIDGTVVVEGEALAEGLPSPLCFAKRTRLSS
jgi:hypothetical protein